MKKAKYTIEWGEGRNRFVVRVDGVDAECVRSEIARRPSLTMNTYIENDAIIVPRQTLVDTIQDVERVVIEAIDQCLREHITGWVEVQE